MRVEFRKEFLRVHYDPVWIGARFILSQLQTLGYRTKHCQSLQLSSPFDLANRFPTTVLNSSDGPAQQLLKLATDIETKKRNSIVASLGLLFSLVLLYCPDEFGGLGNEAILGRHDIRRPLLQLILGVSILSFCGRQWIDPLCRSWHNWFGYELSSLVGTLLCCNLTLSFLALLVVTVFRLYDLGKPC